MLARARARGGAWSSSQCGAVPSLLGATGGGACGRHLSNQRLSPRPRQPSRACASRKEMRGKERQAQQGSAGPGRRNVRALPTSRAAVPSGGKVRPKSGDKRRQHGTIPALANGRMAGLERNLWTLTGLTARLLHPAQAATIQSSSLEAQTSNQTSKTDRQKEATRCKGVYRQLGNRVSGPALRCCVNAQSLHPPPESRDLYAPTKCPAPTLSLRREPLTSLMQHTLPIKALFLPLPLALQV
ncbi:hypothetical protein L1887_51538 [Cichorium endivia]|nr:hypothetical protein L1887_51538 [Cichorium endivia]